MNAGRAPDQGALEDFIAAVYTDRTPTRETLLALADWFEDVLCEANHPHRKAFGLPVAQGRPHGIPNRLRVLRYFWLAQDYGHSKAEAVALASEVFHRDVSVVRRAIRGYDRQKARVSTRVLESALRLAKIPLPPKRKVGDLLPRC